MCIKRLLRIFSQKPTTTPVVTATPSIPVPPTLTIPHPEEPPNDLATVDNVSMDNVLAKFFAKYNISLDNQVFWQGMKFILDPAYQYPAGTVAQNMTMWLQPRYANPGVLAHELAHVSWNLLTGWEKSSFGMFHDAAKLNDPLVKLLYSKNRYGLTSQTEGHAELARYLGRQMPKELLKFYPKIFCD